VNGPTVTPSAAPVQWLTPRDPALSWDGTLELEQVAGGWLPRRFPGRRVATTASQGFANLAAMSTGVRFAVRTDAEEMLLRVSVAADSAPLDVRVDGALAHRATLAGECELAIALAPPDTPTVSPAPRHVEVWLPHLGHIRMTGVGFRGHRTLVPAERTGSRWVAYGSSITHSMFASGPSEAWTALAATGHGWRLHNLGFAGEAHLDQVVAQTIRGLPADLVSLELGINVYLRESFSARSLIPAVCGFIDTIREGHPDLPLAVITPLSSPNRERAPNRVGLTLEQVRVYTAAAVQVLERLGDKNLHILDGLSLLATGEAADLLADGLHPTAEGEHVLADRIGPALRGLLPPPPA